MRHLTASQKIAQLEHRIAHLEKQAFLEGLKQRLSSWVDSKLPYKREVKKAVLSEYSVRDMKSAERAAKGVMRDLKDPHHMTALNMIMKSESTLKGRVEMVLDMKKNPERFEGRTASAFAVAALSVTALLVGVVVATAQSIFKRSSHDKQAFIFSTAIIGVLILALVGMVAVNFFELGNNEVYDKTKEIGYAIIRNIDSLNPIGIKSIEKVSENRNELVMEIEVADNSLTSPTNIAVFEVAFDKTKDYVQVDVGDVEGTYEEVLKALKSSSSVKAELKDIKV